MCSSEPLPGHSRHTRESFLPQMWRLVGLGRLTKNLLCWGSSCQISDYESFLCSEPSNLLQAPFFHITTILIYPYLGPCHNVAVGWFPALRLLSPLYPAMPSVSAETLLFPWFLKLSTSCTNMSDDSPLESLESRKSIVSLVWATLNSSLRLLISSRSLLLLPYSATLQRLQGRPNHLWRYALIFFYNIFTVDRITSYTCRGLNVKYHVGKSKLWTST